jgi:hypothetical protein
MTTMGYEFSVREVAFMGITMQMKSMFGIPAAVLNGSEQELVELFRVSLQSLQDRGWMGLNPDGNLAVAESLYVILQAIQAAQKAVVLTLENSDVLLVVYHDKGHFVVQDAEKEKKIHFYPFVKIQDVLLFIKNRLVNIENHSQPLFAAGSLFQINGQEWIQAKTVKVCCLPEVETVDNLPDQETSVTISIENFINELLEGPIEAA